MSGVGEMLATALEGHGVCSVLAAEEWPWASVTFVGVRHRLRLAIGSMAFLDGIEEAEFDLGRYLLADLVVVERLGLMVVIEALTIEDHRVPAKAGAQAAGARTSACAGTRLGQVDADERTNGGTKRAFVPLAAA